MRIRSQQANEEEKLLKWPQCFVERGAIEATQCEGNG